MEFRTIDRTMTGNILRRSILACVAATATGLLAAPLAYVSNEGSASVSVIDVASDKVVATMKIGEKPRGIALSQDGATLYLSDQTANAVLVVDTATQKEIGRVVVGLSPEAIYLSPDGRRIA